jgi:RNA polymerase sigma-70 factor (ECF subfamily)
MTSLAVHYPIHDREAESHVMSGNPTDEDAARALRFRDATLPHLDSVYTLARYLLRDSADADDAVQECYLRALRHFDTLRSPDVKPWLFAILRNVCRVEFGRRSRVVLYDVNVEPDQSEAAMPLWQEAQDTPETALLRNLNAETIRGLVAALPDAFREVVVLREIEDLSYREISEVVGAPVGTVMSRLARGRALLREAWLRAEYDGDPTEAHAATHAQHHAGEAEELLK